GDDDNDSFTINNGQLNINESPDFEDQPSYTIRIQTTDNGGLSFSKPIILRVNDLQENTAPSDLLLSESNLDENIVAGSPVAILSSVDINTEDTHSYSLVDGDGDTDNDLFTIDGDQLKIIESPDFEQQSAYDIRLQSTDSGGLSHSKTVKLFVNDINEGAAPDFASILGDEIAIQFSALLGESVPSKRRFRVTVDNRVAQIKSTDISTEDGLVFLNLAAAPAAGAEIVIQYTDLAGDQTSGTLELADGADIPSFSDFKVSNDIDETEPPELLNAEVAGDKISLSFNERINRDDSILPSPSQFTAKLNGRKAKLIDVSGGSGAGEIILTLKDTVEFTDELSISYQDLNGDQRTGVIEDLAGNDLLTIKNFEVDNNSFDLSVLGFASAFVDGSLLEVNFDTEIADTKPSIKVFRVEVDGKKSNIKSVDVIPEDFQVVLELKDAVSIDQEVTISYTDPRRDQKKGVVQDIEGNDLITFAAESVQNDTQDLDPLVLEQGELIAIDQILL
ncbi:MAG: SwmB domain-containing protein, partial [Prochlorococcus sp.]